MSADFNFLHWRLGTVRQWLIRIDAADLPPHRSSALRRWVALSNGPRISARIDGNDFFPLTFAPASGERSLRRCLKDSVHPVACRLDVIERDGVAEGALEVLQTPLPVVLEGPLVIHVPTLAASPRAAAAARDLESQLVLASGTGPLLVVQTDLLLARRAPTGGTPVTVFASDRRRLEAVLSGPPGQQHLSVHSIVDPSGLPEAPDARFVAFSGQLRVVPDARGPSSGTDLSPLLPPPHDLLEAWIEYEGLDRAREREALERRKACPLEFQLLAQLAGDTAYEISVANASEALAAWPPSAARGGSKIDADVVVNDLAGGGGPSAEGRLERLEDRPAVGGVVAVLRLNDKSRTPPARGRITAVESRGSARQRERRDEVLSELRSGAFANPRLLDLLLSPERTPVVTAPREGLYETRWGRTLEDRQREAVLKATRLPSILLVQGPPGTGKTEVVAAIVEELLHRHRERTGSEGDDGGRFRILLAGAQNDAASNVVARVEKRVTVAVWQNEDVRREREREALTRSREAASATRDQLRGDVTSEVYRGLKTWADDLESKALRSAGRPSRVVVEQIAGLVASPLMHVLTRQLRADLADLAVLVASTRDAEQAAPRPRAALADVWTPLLSAAAESDGRPEDLDRANLLAERIRRIVELLDDAPPGDTDRTDLAYEWSNFGKRLDLDRSRGAIPSVRLDAFDGLAARTRALLENQQVPPVAFEPSTSDAWEGLGRDAWEWLGEAKRSVAQRLAELENGEEAILEDWIRTLCDSPALYTAMVDRHAPVAASTCQRSKKALGDKPDDFFDVVIIDEAARAGIDILIPMTLGRSIILVGDHLQLPPHIDLELGRQMEEETLERIDIHHESLFRWLRDRLPVDNFVALDRQFRMHEDIGKLVSRLFYEPDNVALTHHWAGPLAAARRPTFGLAGDSPLVWLDTSDRPSDEECFEENAYEAELIVQLLRRMDPEQVARRQREEGVVKVAAVLAYYRKQTDELSRRITLDPKLRDLVEVSTVHSVQGREFPLVILATTKSNRHGRVGFLSDPHAANVAMSRAQRQLLIVGDSRTLAHAESRRGSPPFRKAFELLRDPGSGIRGQILRSAELMS